MQSILQCNLKANCSASVYSLRSVKSQVLSSSAQVQLLAEQRGKDTGHNMVDCVRVDTFPFEGCEFDESK